MQLYHKEELNHCNVLCNTVSECLKIERRNLTKMKQENTNRKEKMIIVEKSTKWWMTVVASGSLAVGLLGGLGIGSLATNALNQQTKVQTSTTTQAQKNQQGNQGGPGIPPGGQSENNQGDPNGRPSQQNGDQNDNSNSQNGSGNNNNSKKKAPSNADGSTKSDKNSSTTENNDSNTTNS